MPAQANVVQTRLLTTRTGFLIRAFYLSLFSFFTVGLGLLCLAIPEVQETLQAFNPDRLLPIAFFALAQLYWALCAWYCARLVLERQFLPFEPLQPCDHPGFAAFVVKWLPRGVGLLATVPMIWTLFKVPRGVLPVWLPFVPVGVSLIFLVGVVFRHQLFGDLVHYTKDPPDIDYGYRRFDYILAKGWALLCALIAIPVVVFLWLLIDPVLAARTIATPALALIAVGSWNLSTGFLLIYLPLSRHWTVWTVYPLVIFVIFSTWVENHNSPSGPPPGIEAARVDMRPTLLQQWKDWKTELDRTECASAPIYFVAASGGASRAAFWTADLLTWLEDEARAQAGEGHNGCFARNIFAISGISGGSLGAATVVSLLADEQVRHAQWPSLAKAAEDFLENDMLAPVAGYLLFPDLVQRFLPRPWYVADRSQGLERTWQYDWAELEAPFAGNAPHAPNWFAGSLDQLYEGRTTILPSLFLNSTRVSDGRRVLQSNIQFAPDDTYDLFSSGLLTKDLTLAGAVHNSARFLYVSPAGLVWQKAPAGGVTHWGYLVDGGYFENSGAATLVPILQQILPTLSEADRSRVELILISNAPSDGRSDYVCVDEPVSPASEPVSSFLIEATAPPLALYDTRNARAHAADMAAARLLDGYAYEHTFELRLPKAMGVPDPPMTWFVSKRVGEQMSSYIRDPESQVDSLEYPRARLAETLSALHNHTQWPCANLNDPSTADSADR